MSISQLDKDEKYFLNKYNFIWSSNSGKSTIVMEILYLLKDHVPNIFVFSPTSEAK